MKFASIRVGVLVLFSLLVGASALQLHLAVAATSRGASCHIICQTDDDCAGQFAQCVFCRPPLEGQGWLCTATNE